MTAPDRARLSPDPKPTHPWSGSETCDSCPDKSRWRDDPSVHDFEKVPSVQSFAGGTVPMASCKTCRAVVLTEHVHEHRLWHHLYIEQIERLERLITGRAASHDDRKGE